MVIIFGQKGVYKMKKCNANEINKKSDWEFLNEFVPAYNRTWASFPMLETADTVYSPLMGNGNMAVCIGGTNDEQVYYIRPSFFRVWVENCFLCVSNRKYNGS